MKSPEDGETTSRSGPLASGDRDHGAESAVAHHDDPERTVVVPARQSHGDEEPTIVVADPQRLADDPERTQVAPTSLGPQRSKGPDVGDGIRDSSPSHAAPDVHQKQAIYRQPAANQSASPLPGAPEAPVSVPGSAPGLASSYPPLAPQNPPPPGIAQPGFGPRPGPYGQANPYSFPPPGAYQAPYGPAMRSGGPRSTQWTAALLWGGIGLAAVAVATVLVIGLSNPDFVSTKKLDVQAAQVEVQHVLTDDVTGYGDKNVGDVTCNHGTNVTVKQGSSFTCQVSVDGTPRQVTVTFLDNDGNYEVGRPD